METLDLRFIPLGMKHVMHINNANARILNFQIHVLPKLSNCVAWKDFFIFSDRSGFRNKLGHQRTQLHLPSYL